VLSRGRRKLFRGVARGLDVFEPLPVGRLSGVCLVRSPRPPRCQIALARAALCESLANEQNSIGAYWNA
jgi:hypothetical protein